MRVASYERVKGITVYNKMCGFHSLSVEEMVIYFFFSFICLFKQNFWVKIKREGRVFAEKSIDLNDNVYKIFHWLTVNAIDWR